MKYATPREDTNLSLFFDVGNGSSMQACQSFSGGLLMR